MDNYIDVSGLPHEAQVTISNFIEFIKQKYSIRPNADHLSFSARKKLIRMMEKGLYRLPDDYKFNRDELYD